MPLVPPDFHIDEAALKAAFSQKPKVIVVCNPSNPCGKVFREDELLLIARLAEEHDCFVITDEVYEHIVFEPHRHVHFAALPGMRNGCSRAACTPMACAPGAPTRLPVTN